MYSVRSHQIVFRQALEVDSVALVDKFHFIVWELCGGSLAPGQRILSPHHFKGLGDTSERK